VSKSSTAPVPYPTAVLVVPADCVPLEILIKAPFVAVATILPDVVFDDAKPLRKIHFIYHGLPLVGTAWLSAVLVIAPD